MKLKEDLIETIKGAIEDYRYNKTKDIEIDDDTDMEIFDRTRTFLESIEEDINYLDEDIDCLVEHMNEPTDYDLQQDNIARTRELQEVS